MFGWFVGGMFRQETPNFMIPTYIVLPYFMITGARALNIEHSIYTIIARLIAEMLFMLFPGYNTV